MIAAFALLLLASAAISINAMAPDVEKLKKEIEGYDTQLEALKKEHEDKVAAHETLFDELMKIKMPGDVEMTNAFKNELLAADLENPDTITKFGKDAVDSAKKMLAIDKQVNDAFVAFNYAYNKANADSIINKREVAEDALETLNAARKTALDALVKTNLCKGAQPYLETLSLDDLKKLTVVDVENSTGATTRALVANVKAYKAARKNLEDDVKSKATLFANADLSQLDYEDLQKIAADKDSEESKKIIDECRAHIIGNINDRKNNFDAIKNIDCSTLSDAQLNGLMLELDKENPTNDALAKIMTRAPKIVDNTPIKQTTPSTEEALLKRLMGDEFVGKLTKKDGKYAFTNEQKAQMIKKLKGLTDENDKKALKALVQASDLSVMQKMAMLPTIVKVAVPLSLAAVVASVGAAIAFFYNKNKNAQADAASVADNKKAGIAAAQEEKANAPETTTFIAEN